MTLERALVERYRWSLADIDRTDVESLLAFVFSGRPKKPAEKRATAYCDQVDFL